MDREAYHVSGYQELVPRRTSQRSGMGRNDLELQTIGDAQTSPTNVASKNGFVRASSSTSLPRDDGPGEDSRLIEARRSIKIASNTESTISFKEALFEPAQIICGLAIFFPIYVNGTEFLLGVPQKGTMLTRNTFIGLPLVCLGLACFSLGLHEGLMPLGNIIGEALKENRSIAAPMGLLLGLLLTYGEPAIGALLEVASLNPSGAAAQMLTRKQVWTVGAIGLGVGVASAMGIWRLAYNISLRRILLVCMICCLFITAFAPQDIKGLAWDSGAVTTGPVTVPVVLALGAGLRETGAAGSAADGYGVVSLASIFPVVGILFVYTFISAGDKIEGSQVDYGMWEPLVLSLWSFIPLLFGLLCAILVLQSWHKLRMIGLMPVGIGLLKVFLGLVLFLYGLNLGLLPLGHEAGKRMAGSFKDTERRMLGLFLIMAFGFITVGAAQLVEPSLNVLGTKAEESTNGRISKQTLIARVAFGVATGTLTGVLRIIYGFDLLYVLVPVYCFSLYLNSLASDDLLGIAWDAAGVTTGSVTVPIILALGMGLAEATSEGSEPTSPFGILSCASVFPIPVVLLADIPFKTLLNPILNFGKPNSQPHDV